MGTIEEGSSRFPDAKGEIVFTHIFEDDDKRHVLEMYYGLCSNNVENFPVSNIILPTNEEKMNVMTCSELNLFIGGSK